MSASLYHWVGSVIPYHLLSPSTEVKWKSTVTKEFSLKSCYVWLLQEHSLLEPQPSFPYKVISYSKLPTRVCFYVWQLVLNKIGTLDNLDRRGMANNGRCFFCNICMESVNHLFLSCSFPSQVWREVIPQVCKSFPSTIAQLIEECKVQK